MRFKDVNSQTLWPVIGTPCSHVVQTDDGNNCLAPVLESRLNGHLYRRKAIEGAHSTVRPVGGPCGLLTW